MVMTLAEEFVFPTDWLVDSVILKTTAYVLNFRISNLYSNGFCKDNIMKFWTTKHEHFRTAIIKEITSTV